MTCLGSELPNILIIIFFTALFKRRHQAFSYMLLFTLQILLMNFFQLATHQARPNMAIDPSLQNDWITANQV